MSKEQPQEQQSPDIINEVPEGFLPDTEHQPQPKSSPDIIDKVPDGFLPETADEVKPQTSREHYTPGYKVPKIGGPSDGVRYEPGMPIRLDADTNPQTGDPRVPKLRP